MALIKFKIDDTTNPALPVVDTTDVLNLHAGDRLLFTTASGTDVLVNLGGDETSSTLVALVKQKGPVNFEVLPLADGRLTVRLKPPAGSGPDGDPPF
jgi:hypothetical protein